MTSFPTSIASKPLDIADGLVILAAHVSSCWDEVIAIETEIKGGGAGTLVLDIRPTSAGNTILTTRQSTGDSQARFTITGNGAMAWGSGTASQDVTLARNGARTLKIGGNLQVQSTSGSDVTLSVQAGAGATGNVFQVLNSGAADLFSVDGAGVLTLAGSGYLVGLNAPAYNSPRLSFGVTGEANHRFAMDASGDLRWGDGTAVPDTVIGRKDVDTLQLPSKIYVGTTGGECHIGNDCFLVDIGVAHRFGVRSSTNAALGAIRFGTGFYSGHPTSGALIGGDANGRIIFNRDVLTSATVGAAFQVGTASDNGGGAYLSVGGVWTNISDVNVKENFTELDPMEVLRKLLAMPVPEYNYIGDGSKHVTPTAQDFVAAFGTGVDDTSLSPADIAGVALIAIKALAEFVGFPE